MMPSAEVVGSIGIVTPANASFDIAHRCSAVEFGGAVHGAVPPDILASVAGITDRSTQYIDTIASFRGCQKFNDSHVCAGLKG